MNHFLDMDFYYGRFRLFSITHILTLATITGVILLIYFFRYKIRNNKTLDKHLRIIIVVVMILAETSTYYWAVSHGIFKWNSSLPLNLCGMNIYLGAILLITKNYNLYEVLLFMGSLGALQAILTPDVTFNFPHYRYIEFFTAHACVLISIFYMTFIYNYKPKVLSIIKSYIILALYSIVIGIVNVFLKGNYMYLARKPEHMSLLDYLGPWPWYIIVVLIAILPYFFFIYFLFNAKELFKNMKKRH